MVKRNWVFKIGGSEKMPSPKPRTKTIKLIMQDQARKRDLEKLAEKKQVEKAVRYILGLDKQDDKRGFKDDKKV